MLQKDRQHSNIGSSANTPILVCSSGQRSTNCYKKADHHSNIGSSSQKSSSIIQKQRRLTEKAEGMEGLQQE